MFTHTIACPYCDEHITQNFSDYVISSDVIDENRAMGAETEHSIECDSFECPHCQNVFTVHGSVFEYPVGAYNDHELFTEKL